MTYFTLQALVLLLMFGAFGIYLRLRKQPAAICHWTKTHNRGKLEFFLQTTPIAQLTELASVRNLSTSFGHWQSATVLAAVATVAADMINRSISN